MRLHSPMGAQNNIQQNVDGYRTMPEPLFPVTSLSDYEYPSQYTQSLHVGDGAPKPLTTRESVELFQESVDTAKQGIQQSLAGSGNAGEALRPKLTIDLSRRNLGQIPSEVVAIIRQDVERLQLAHNQLRQISPDFSTCSALKYLNLRDNRFQEIPQAIFGLPQLEILDLGRNYLTNIPEEISNLKALRVFSIHHNQIEDLPQGLGNINTLRVLKLSANPFKPELRDVVIGCETLLSPLTPALPTDENEREMAITARVIDYLRQTQSLIDNYDDGPLETPRALSRFPVHPTDSGYLTSGSESASGPRSPGFIKSSRTHHRVHSSQYNSLQNASPRRPGLAPLASNNERSWSNTEGIFQATQNSKSRRMRSIQKKQPGLGSLDEGKAHRNSYHLRGQSHSSALRNVSRAGDQNEGDAVGPDSSQKGIFIRRLSSVPEQRRQVHLQDDLIETAKGILYSLHLVQPYLSSMVTLVKDSKAKRSSLERYQHQASVQLEHLDQSLHDASLLGDQSKNAKRAARKMICRATHACIAVYGNIAGLLLKNIKQLVMDGDPRYIRTLMLLLYGSLNEERNARRRLALKQTKHRPIDFASTKASTEPARVNRDDALTPTQDHPKIGGWWSNHSIGQKSLNHANLDAVLSSHGSAPTYSAVTSRTNSRSNSRVCLHHIPLSTSVLSTPQSGESFGPGFLVSRSRSGSVRADYECTEQAQIEQDQFERICRTLNRAADQGLEVITGLEPRFLKSLDKSRKQYTPLDIRNLWATVVRRTRLCGETSDSLKRRLKANDPDARNAPDFWRLAMRFIDTYGNLLASLRQARQLNQIDPDLRHVLRDVLRPVHDIAVEAGTLIKHSPWNRFTAESQPPSQVQSRAPTPVQNEYSIAHIQTQMMPPPVPTLSTANYHGYSHGRVNGSNGSVTGLTTSPHNHNVPATPLSAALGPAAQATVPSTPASGGGSMAGVFEGNVFQRADNLLLQGPTTMFRRQGGGS
ncbi:MAG: hypothetical protein Q9163_004902 [Psora crenata]